MYTKRNYSLKTMLNWTRRYLYIFFLFSAIPVFLFKIIGWNWLHLPWLPISLIGTALAFIVGFKNNAAYGRLWEARKIYGGIVNTSRSLTIMVNDFITNEFSPKKYSDEELFKIKKRIVLRHIAWMTSLRYALRQMKPWERSHINNSDIEHMKAEGIKIHECSYTLKDELKGYLSKEEENEILKKTNKQTATLNLQSKEFKDLKLNKLIDDFRHMEMERIIVELFTLQGKAERIKNFPYPRQFATLNLFFIWIFVFILPYGIMNEFEKIGDTILANANSNNGQILDLVQYHIGENFVWLSIPFSMVISWIFHTMERIGEVSENPFEGMSNDVPITTISRAIEIDMREMIGDDENEIPKPIPVISNTQM
ncbi:bestrophin family protein [Aureivirga sp. CE67]|uniref:bestrophin family protein n=1 Tax=Aureivirga sp. CE67 TaxID=1788983 RepID=UPI0018CB43F3|nr:bestrophin family ion channel [Aureivirga sp. CE67]